MGLFDKIFGIPLATSGIIAPMPGMPDIISRAYNDNRYDEQITEALIRRVIKEKGYAYALITVISSYTVKVTAVDDDNNTKEISLVSKVGVDPTLYVGQKIEA